MGDYGQEQEEKEKFRQRNNDNGKWNLLLRTIGASTHNPKKLAQILTVLDLACNRLGWDVIKTNKSGDIVRLPFKASDIINAYQAGIDGKYHKDLVDVAKLDEYLQAKAKMRQTQIKQDQSLMTE